MSNKPRPSHPKMQPIKVHREFQLAPFTRVNVKRPWTQQNIINLSSDTNPRIGSNKKHYFNVQLVNTINKGPEMLTFLLKRYAKKLRQCPNIKKLYLFQLILTEDNLKPLVTLVKSLRRLETISLDIKLSEALPDPIVHKFYSQVNKLRQIREIRIFTSTFYRYPHNILPGLFLRPNLQSRLQVIELTLTRELNEKYRELFFQNLKNFKSLKDLTLDFSRASTTNMLPLVFDNFQHFKSLESLSLNLTGQYVTSDAYQNLAQALSARNMKKLSLTFKCTSTIGEDLSEILVNCPKLVYLKLVFLEESKLTPESIVPLEKAFKGLGRLKELSLDLSQSIYCNFLLRKIAHAFTDQSCLERLFLKFNSKEASQNVKGLAMNNIKDILLSHPNLKSLNLQCSNSQGIQDNIDPLIQGLKELRKLEYFSFYLHYCPLSDYSLGTLLQTLAKKKQLKGLNLAIDSFKISNKSLFEIKESLKGLSALEEVSIHLIKWRISQDALKNLSSMLLSHKRLRTIEIKFQDINSERKEKLAKDFELEVSREFPKHRLSVEYMR